MVWASALRRHAKSFEAQIAASFLTAAVLLFGVLFCFGHAQARRQDDAQARFTATAIAEAVDAKCRFMQNWLADYAYWDDFYRRMGLNDDTAWVDYNVGKGKWKTTTIPMSGTFVADRNGATLFRYWHDEAPYGLSDLRGFNLKAALHRADRLKNPVIVRAIVADQPYIVGIGRIRPMNVALFDRRAAPRYVIWVQPITGEILREVGHAMSIDGLHWVSDGVTDGPTVDLLQLPGVAGRLTWAARRPGTEMMEQAILPAIMLVLLTVGIGAMQYARARRLGALLRTRQEEATGAAEKSRAATDKAVRAEEAAQALIRQLGEKERTVLRLSSERDREQQLRKKEAQDQSIATLSLFESEFSTALQPIVDIADELTRQADALQREAIAGERAAIVAAETATTTTSAVNSVVSESLHLESATTGLQRDIGNAVQSTLHAQQVTVELMARLGELSTRAQTVENVIGSVADIAASINLLALNARIEASRAGAAGRGFAVVAEEVKQLAETTARSVSMVASVLREMQDQAQLAASGAETIGQMMIASAEATGSSRHALERQSAIVRTISGATSGAQTRMADTDIAIRELSGLVGSSEKMARSINRVALDLTQRADSLRRSALLFTGNLRDRAP